MIPPAWFSDSPSRPPPVPTGGVTLFPDVSPHFDSLAPPSESSLRTHVVGLRISASKLSTVLVEASERLSTPPTASASTSEAACESIATAVALITRTIPSILSGMQSSVYELRALDVHLAAQAAAVSRLGHSALIHASLSSLIPPHTTSDLEAEAFARLLRPPPQPVTALQAAISLLSEATRQALVAAYNEGRASCDTVGSELDRVASGTAHVSPNTTVEVEPRDTAVLRTAAEAFWAARRGYDDALCDLELFCGAAVVVGPDPTTEETAVGGVMKGGGDGRGGLVAPLPTSVKSGVDVCFRSAMGVRGAAVAMFDDLCARVEAADADDAAAGVGV